jgi:mannose-6-phosphate isomerase
MNWKPIFFEYIVKERIWGGKKLSTSLNKKIPFENNGESWELSAVQENETKITNGDFQDKTLSEIIQFYPDEILGKTWVEKNGLEFPLLFKYIDAKEDLSVQLHPDDLYAKEKHKSRGKNEMWYVVNADVDARVIVGFKHETSPKHFLKHLSNNQITDLLKEIKVKKGDVFHIKTGTIHAIGAGVLLAEIQQTSDVTYRIFDWNRVDTHGKSRELHIQNALECLNYELTEGQVFYSENMNEENVVVDSEFFTTTLLPLKGTFSFINEDAFKVFMCVEGEATLEVNNQKFTVHQGLTFLIPAALKNFLLTGNARFLIATVR